MKNVLILGGQGFIGYNLTKKLISENLKISIFEKYINEERKLQGCKYVSGDFVNIQNYPEIFEDVDVVYHLISTTMPNKDISKIQFDIETNLIPSVKLMDIAREKGVKKVIFVSSGGTIYGEQETSPTKEDAKKFPICAYGINKLAIEKYFYMFHKLFGLDYTILRLSNPYGLGHTSKSQGVINVFADKIKNNEDIEIWGTGEVSRDYIHIDDVISALYLSIKADANEKILNISSGKAVSLNEIVNILKEVSGREFNVIYKNARDFDVKTNCLDNSLAKEVLGWKPEISLKEGISRLF